MTSASLAPRTFSFCNIVKESVRYDSSDLTRLADWGRVMQAMNLEGVREGRSSKGVEVPLDERASVPAEEREERMPDRMAMPSVPGARLAAMPVGETLTDGHILTTSQNGQGHIPILLSWWLNGGSQMTGSTIGLFTRR